MCTVCVYCTSVWGQCYNLVLLQSVQDDKARIHWAQTVKEGSDFVKKVSAALEVNVNVEVNVVTLHKLSEELKVVQCDILQ